MGGEICIPHSKVADTNVFDTLIAILTQNIAIICSNYLFADEKIKISAIIT